MKRHWQKKPLLVRQAMPGFAPLLSRAALFDLAADEAAESRLITQRGGWRLRHGPIARRSLPPLSQPQWTLLVQGVDLHDERVHALMQQFRFIPDARLDDVMISYASDGGGVGPHFDSYDVFLLQAAGRRRWRIGRQKDLSLVQGLPLKILADFQPEEEYLLEPGDMLYLPPRWAHDGVAEGGECMTYSIGFRQPAQGEVGAEMLQRMAEEAVDMLGDTAYRDPDQPAVTAPARVPGAMLAFAREAVDRAARDPQQLAMLLGEWLSEPKPMVGFQPGRTPSGAGAVALDRRTRMLYDDHHVFINGESYLGSGRDAVLMRQLADQRRLGATERARLSAGAAELLGQWIEAGWAHES